ncbi:lipid phosphate phosphatase 1 [Bipolaris maydis]|nr:lipid phosphate phosphatase 1 [Bipolaris maydis]KAJ6280392.1 phosphatidic acid phosphatase type 2/haloperoxidase [Bipolaris maydis]
MDDWTSKQLPERLPFSKKRLSKKVIFSYIGDYLIIIVLMLTFAIVDKIPPFHQPFSLDNYTLHYPFATKERVPVIWLCVYVVLAPAVIIGIYTMVIDGLFSHQTAMPANRTGLKRLSGRYRFKDRLWELNCGILGLGLSIGAAFTITGALKNAIGKPRPDLISRCLVDQAKINTERYALQTIDICTQKDNYILQDGFKSFPSGHSSVSFAGLFYLSIYLSGKLHVLDAKGEVWRTFIVMVPTLGAALITGTRIMDARHHPFDVISGALLGILVAWGSYRQYFPPVSETWRKGRAYPIRAWGKASRAPPHVPMMTEDDVQTLRAINKPVDEERGEASGYSATAVVPPDGDVGGNVFRQQIHNSQRRRQESGSQYGVNRSDTGASSNYRTETMTSGISSKVNRYTNQLPSTNPFAADVARQRQMDTYDYSSSEEDENYELQSRTGIYNPVSGRLTDTGYHPPAGISPVPTPPPPHNAVIQNQQPTMSQTGDLSDRRDVAPVPPPHATSMPQQI